MTDEEKPRLRLAQLTLDHDKMMILMACMRLALAELPNTSATPIDKIVLRRDLARILDRENHGAKLEEMAKHINMLHESICSDEGHRSSADEGDIQA